MTDTMTMSHRPFPSVGSISQTHRDLTDNRYKDLRRRRKIKFFANGEKYFKGKDIYLTPHRYMNFNDLLSDLTHKLPGNVHLPYGVRQIYTPTAGHRVKNIEDLQDGQSYVCAGFETFKVIRYGKDNLEPWSHSKPHNHEFYQESHVPQFGRGVYGRGFQPGPSVRHSYPYRGTRGTFGSRAGQGSYWGSHQAQGDGGQMKPKVITVVRAGDSSRSDDTEIKQIKILLNKRSVQSFDQLAKDISEAFGPKWKNNKVKEIYTVKGKRVEGISHFFRDDEVFIGVGNEGLSNDVYGDILEELYPDNPYAKNLMKEWERNRRKNKPQIVYKGHHAYNDDKDDIKRDSGLGSDSSNKDDVDSREDAPSQRTRSKKNQDSHDSSGEEDLVLRLERERQRAADKERDKAHRRMQKRLDAEKRALEEEKRKRGLVPLKPVQDPFKKMLKAKEKERRKKAAEEKARQETEQMKQEQQLREQREKQPKVILVVKEEPEESVRSKSKTPRPESESDAKSRAADQSPRRKTKEVIMESESERDEEEQPKITDRSEDETKDKSKGKRKSLKDSLSDDKENKEEEKPKSPEKRAKSEEKEVKVIEKEKSETKTETKTEKQDQKKPKEQKTPENVEEKKEKENIAAEPEKKEKKPKEKKKNKTIIVKTKLERQISNIDHVLSKYEPGKVLGDGNFAIVKQCKLQNTNQDYAMKIIDKAKLKGKEGMLENEIGIMKICDQPNIVKLIEEYETKDEIYLIMELVKGGDLFDAITSSVKFPEKDASGMVSDLGNALFYLHSRHVVHRDLKPENLLVCRNKDGSVTLKLADFGLAMEVTQPIYTVCGTPTYVAPEILSEIGYGLEVDMWAVGVITYILLCGFPPFRSPDRNQTELFEFIKAGEYEFLSPYWDKISKSAKDLIEHLLVVEKKKRYKAEDVLCHPWVITRGSSIVPPTKIDEFRKNLRHDLEVQAKANREHFNRIMKSDS